MVGTCARRLVALGLLLSLAGCQSWFYYPKADVLPKWEEFRAEGAQVQLYLEPEPGAAEKAAAALRVPAERVDLAVLLPAAPPLVRGKLDPSTASVTEIDARRVSHAYVRRYSSDKAAHNALIGLGIVGGAVGLAGLTYLIVFAVSLQGLGADHGR